MRERFKNLIPNWAKTIVRKSWEQIENNFLFRENQIEQLNFIVTSHKCGSQWFKSIFRSAQLHKLANYHYYAFKLLPLNGFDTAKLTERKYELKGLEPGIYGPVYVGPSSLVGLSTSDNVCVVIRDPRNLIVSWYDSILKTHALMGNVGEMRNQLSVLDKPDGLDIMIDHAINFGTFEVMEEWLIAERSNPRVKIIKFEDIFSTDQQTEFESMLEHFGLNYRHDGLSEVLTKFSFQRLSKSNKHYKKGESRTWNGDLNQTQVNRICALCPNVMNLYSEN